MPKVFSNSSVAVAAEELPAVLRQIRTMTTNDLRSTWLSITGKPPSRQLSGDLLKRMVLHRVQEQAVRKLDRRVEAMLDRLANGQGASPSQLRVGTVLVREHAGVLHQVMVVDGGFAWKGQTLPSLSAVAKVISGTTWNGNRFFGLRQTASKTTHDPRVRERIDTKPHTPVIVARASP